MATSPVPQWAREMSPHHRGPTGAGVLRLAVLVVLIVIVLQAMTATHGGRAADREQESLCDLHRGQSAWDAICEETRRGR